jgi:heat shock protein HslJ
MIDGFVAPTETTENHMPASITRRQAGIGLATLALAAATSITPRPARAETLGLAGRWLAEDIDGGGVIDRLQTLLEIGEDGSASGTGGCNRFMSRAEIKDDAITFAPIAGTRMMCAPAAMDQETKFFAALPLAVAWKIDQPTRKLTLMDARSRPLVVFARMD